MNIRPIEELDTSHVEEWLERFEMMTEVNSVYIAAQEEAKPAAKRSLLLAFISAKGDRLLKAYIASNLSSTKTYGRLKKVIVNNMAPKNSVVSESTEARNFRIKLAASKCDFGDSFDRMERDKFICGLQSEKLRVHLISDSSIKTSAQVLYI